MSGERGMPTGAPVESADWCSDRWEPQACVYGICGLLSCRAHMCVDDTKPSAMAHLKFLSTGKPSPSPVSSRSKKSRNGDAVEAVEEQPPEVPEYDPEATEAVADDRGAGAWWTVLTVVIVRETLSLWSDQIKSIEPGAVLQQAGPAQQFVSGAVRGVVRLPIEPHGYVTADASSAKGPRFLRAIDPPTWRVNYVSGQICGDVLVRAGVGLESERIKVLKRDDIVEQTGASELLDKGILRLPIKFVKGGQVTTGWVSQDASGAGGPIFLVRCETSQ